MQLLPMQRGMVDDNDEAGVYWPLSAMLRMTHQDAPTTDWFPDMGSSRPRELLVYPNATAPLIALVARELNIRVKEVGHLPMLEEARESLLSFFG